MHGRVVARLLLTAAAPALFAQDRVMSARQAPARTKEAVLAAGKPFDVVVQFTDTLVWLDGRWVLAAGHVSRLPSEKAG